MQLAFQPQSLGADAPRETQLLGGSVSASPGRSILDGGGGPAPAAVKTEAADAGANGDAGPSGGDDDGGDAKRQRLGESPDGSLSSHLLGVFSSELELSQQQVDALGAQKDLIRTDRENVTAALALMKELRQKVSDHMKTSQAITDGLRRILTPVQVTRRAILAQFWRNYSDSHLPRPAGRQVPDVGREEQGEHGPAQLAQPRRLGVEGRRSADGRARPAVASLHT